jgi:sarcosine oxidase subunit alpha
MPAANWAQEQVEALAEAQCRLLPRTTVWGYYDGNTLAAVERVGDHKAVLAKGEPRHRMWTIRARTVVLATGALERPIVFPGNDRPGVMLASAAERYLNEFGVLPGREIVLFTNNDTAYRAVSALKRRQARASRNRGCPRDRRCGACCRKRMWRQADVGPCRRRDQWPASHQGSADAAFQRRPRLGLIGGIACDCLLVSGGWSPAMHLASQAGERPVWSDDLQTFLPPKRTEEWVGAGGMSGAMSTAAAISSGLAAGLVAAGGLARPRRRLPYKVSRPTRALPRFSKSRQKARRLSISSTM